MQELKGVLPIISSVTDKEEREVKITLDEESLDRVPDSVIIDPDELQKYAERALDIGLRILQQISVVEGIGQQAEEIVRRVNNKAGEIPDEVAEAVRKLIGTEEGQVLRPVQLQLDTLLKLTNPELDGSVPKWIQEMTKAGFSEQAEPLADVITELQDALVKAGIIEDVKEKTPLKGDYEDLVNKRLQDWADKSSSLFRPNIEFTKDKPGVQKVTTGDVVVRLQSESGSEISICVEAKNYGSSNPQGKPVVERSLATGIPNRECIAGLFVNRTSKGLSQQLGHWYEGEIEGVGPYIVVTDEYLELGIRALITKLKMQELLSGGSDKFDTTALNLKVQELRTGIKKLVTINSKATKMGDLSTEIKDLAKVGYQDLQTMLSAIEKLIEDATTD